MLFQSLKTLPDDPVGLTYMALATDPNPDKIDLGIGVYRDDAGRSPIMGCVREAQSRLLAKQTTMEYMTPSGNMRYSHLMERLILGDDHAVLNSGRLLTVQTPGAGGGLRTAANLVKLGNPDATIWVPSPTWSHQHLVMESARLRIAEYPYYDIRTNLLQFDRMVAALSKTGSGDVVLLHGCCHNPTGEDLRPDQWRQLAGVLASRGALPFIDLAYQGFGDGIEDDVFGTRIMAASVPELILAASSSKSFGVYRERAGIISVLCQTPDDKKNTARHVSRITRALYFMPPDRGAALIVEILEDDKLRSVWRSELDVMRKRIVALRASLTGVLSRRLQDWDFDFIKRQKGMFSLMPLSSEALLALRQQHGIYLMPDARINLAALTQANVERVGAALADAIAQSQQSATTKKRHI